MTGIMMAVAAGGITAAPLTAAASPSTATWNFVDPYYLASSASTATPTGGTAAYTYAWETVSGPGYALTPSISATDFLSDTNTQAVYRCLVTDSLGASAYTNNVTVDP